MLQFLLSYFANLRVIQKNISAASRFSLEDRVLVAKQLFMNQRLIVIIEGGGAEQAPLSDAAINDLLAAADWKAARFELGFRRQRDVTSSM